MKRQIVPHYGIRTLLALCIALALVFSLSVLWCAAEPGVDETSAASSTEEGVDGAGSSSAAEEGNASSQEGAEGSTETSSEYSTETPSEGSSEAPESETSSETSSSGEETDPAYKVTLQAAGEYAPEGTVTITATVEDLDENIDFTGFFFDLRYDTDALTLTNTVGENNTVDCVTEKPGDRWENLTKNSETPGTLRVAVAVSDNLSQVAEEDGSLVLTLSFAAQKDLPENTVLTVSDVIAMDGMSVSHSGLGTALTLTFADEANTSPAPTSSESSAPQAGDVGSMFPFLLGVGALLGLIVAVRLRRKADHDPARK